MSGKPAEAEEADVCCANCGVAEVDDIQLEDCDGCDLVKYCSDKCMEVHREHHEEECQKRAQELHDRKLFRQPDGGFLGECPLCFLPMPLDPQKSTFYSCCSILICNGCCHANEMSVWNHNCPFCREPPPEDDEEDKKRLMKRVKANDPAALRFIGTERFYEGDHGAAVEYWKKAAELEEIRSHYELSCLYGEGNGVKKNEEKAVYHAEQAAIGGHPDARYNLGCTEGDNGNIERAVKHFIIAANLGCETSMKELWSEYKDGNITKEELEATLRTHKVAIDATKSPEREAAEAWRQRQRERDA